MVVAYVLTSLLPTFVLPLFVRHHRFLDAALSLCPARRKGRKGIGKANRFDVVCLPRLIPVYTRSSMKSLACRWCFGIESDSPYTKKTHVSLDGWTHSYISVP